MSEHEGWIGVDLDGTLAHYDGWEGPTHIGEPIKPMLLRVKLWLRQGKDVRIFTARVAGGEGPIATPQYCAVHDVVIPAIDQWCLEHLGQVLPITCSKDFGMIELWDDRCVQVVPNVGLRIDALLTEMDKHLECYGFPESQFSGISSRTRAFIAAQRFQFDRLGTPCKHAVELERLKLGETP